MALDPSIALGIRPLEVPNQLAQYAQMAQVENAQQQNALAQFQLGAARRAEQGQNALGRAYGEYYGGGGSMGGGAAPGAADLTAAYGMGGAGMGGAPGAARGGINYDNMRQTIVDKLRTTAPNLIPAELARINEMEQKGLLARKTLTDIDTAGLTQQEAKLKLATTRTAQFRDQLNNVNSPEAAAPWTIAMYNDPHLKDTISSVPLEAALAEIPKTPDAFNVWKNQNALGMAEFIKQNKPTTFAQDTGPGGRVMSFPGLGGPATLVPGSEFTKSMTFADRNAAARLAFDQGKFAWEKANPGFELKEAEDGSIVGVNKRTLQAFPVTVGGAAPAAAPAMPGGGVPGARLPAPSAGPAAPGMAPPAAGAPGVPLMGKGTAMTETQSNAAMFGGAMAQAQNTIKQLEKSGTVKNAVVPGLLTGLAQMVPFGVGDGIGNVIQSTFNADPTGLIGPNADQQKLAQSQLAFATAYLRKTSGAAFGASEISNTIKEFFPLIGEGEKVIAQKAAARERAVEGMKISTNREGKKYIEGYGGGGAPAAAGRGGGIPNATPTNPLGLPGL
jgi:hypothetical protein